MKKSLIRKGSTINYKTFLHNGKKEYGIGKVISIDKKAGTLEVMDLWHVYTCLIKDCVNVCNW